MLVPMVVMRVQEEVKIHSFPLKCLLGSAGNVEGWSSQHKNSYHPVSLYFVIRTATKSLILGIRPGVGRTEVQQGVSILLIWGHRWDAGFVLWHPPIFSWGLMNSMWHYSKFWMLACVYIYLYIHAQIIMWGKLGWSPGDPWTLRGGEEIVVPGTRSRHDYNSTISWSLLLELSLTSKVREERLLGHDGNIHQFLRDWQVRKTPLQRF